MGIFYYFYEIILEALFPLSPIEKELFSYSPQQASATFKPAPPYTGLAVGLPEAKSLFAYKDKRVEQLIWNIKYKRSPQAVKIAGHALFERLNKIDIRRSKDAVTPDILILPMPMTKQRRRERGYNQCELLTNEMKRLDGEKEAPENSSAANFMFENNLLIRTRHDSRHTLKGRADRLQSAKGIFGINERMLEKFNKETNKETLGDPIVIIIDDVITTGSTMREAIDTMRKVGFKRVYGLSVAH